MPVSAMRRGDLVAGPQRGAYPNGNRFLTDTKMDETRQFPAATKFADEIIECTKKIQLFEQFERQPFRQTQNVDDFVWCNNGTTFRRGLCLLRSVLPLGPTCHGFTQDRSHSFSYNH